jgi:aspartate 1-decarboxylase
MLRQMLKSKIHRATITGAQPDYEGSIVCPEGLLRVADILPGEKVLVANLSNGARFETYAIPGKEREVVLRGAASRLGQIGDVAIVMAFGLMDENEAGTLRPAIVLVDEHNCQRKAEVHDVDAEV